METSYGELRSTAAVCNKRSEALNCIIITCGAMMVKAEIELIQDCDDSPEVT